MTKRLLLNILSAAACCFMAVGSACPQAAETSNATHKVIIEIGSQKWQAEFADNATARALIQRMPFEVPMQDLYARELCYRFPDALPANEINHRGYDVGEIIYWAPRHSFVIMYAQNGEEFDMQGIGQISGDVSRMGTGRTVNVRFSLAK